nr:hypothetical protein Iba_chr04dCG4540 [Ipomoea batatas]
MSLPNCVFCGSNPDSTNPSLLASSPNRWAAFTGKDSDKPSSLFCCSVMASFKHLKCFDMAFSAKFAKGAALFSPATDSKDATTACSCCSDAKQWPVNGRDESKAWGCEGNKRTG